MSASLKQLWTQVKNKMLIGLVRHLVAQKMKMKIEALASRLGVLAKQTKKSEEGGREEGPGREVVTLPLQLSTFARTPSLAYRNSEI